MRQDPGKLLFWAVAIITAFGLATLGWALATNNATALEAIGWVTGAVIPGIAYLVSELQKRSIRVFLFTHRVRSFFSSNTLTWGLSANYSGSTINAETLDIVATKLGVLVSNKVTLKVKKVNPYNQIVEVTPGPTLDLTFTPAQPIYGHPDTGTAAPFIQLAIRNYRVGYRQVARVMKYEVAPILEAVGQALSGADAKYNLTIDFDRAGNPFFGLYIANIPPELVTNFSIRLDLRPRGQAADALISSSKVAIDTSSQRVLTDLALQFLAFDYASAEYLSNA